MTKSFWWSDFTSRDFDNLDPDKVVAVLPIAATEQHGPHLPVATDHAIMAGMLETVFPLMPADIDMRVLPIQAVGKSNEHIRSPGTLTISATTLIDLWCDLGDSVARAGIRKKGLHVSHCLVRLSGRVTLTGKPASVQSYSALCGQEDEIPRPDYSAKRTILSHNIVRFPDPDSFDSTTYLI